MNIANLDIHTSERKNDAGHPVIAVKLFGLLECPFRTVLFLSVLWWVSRSLRMNNTLRKPGRSPEEPWAWQCTASCSWPCSRLCGRL